MEVLIIIAAIVLGGYLLIVNFMEGFAVFAYGWSARNHRLFFGSTNYGTMKYSYHWSGWKDIVLWFLTLPGAIVGFVLGIITFQWTHW